MMNNSGSSAREQQCSGPSSSTWPNWDQNNNNNNNNGGVSVSALEQQRVQLHYHHHNYNTTSNNNSESTSTSTCSRLGWEWDHHNAMLLSHERQGDGTDPTKPPMATATLVNSELRSYFLEGMQLPYGNLQAHGHNIGQLLSPNPPSHMRNSCFPGMGSSNSGDIQFFGDVVKQENYGGLSRIGLSLGGAYFSAEEDVGFGGRLVKRARGNHGGGSSQVVPMCQAEGCRADLSCAKHYHRRHKVCEQHSKASLVVLGGQNQRFCQQCSRFHLLSEFDDGKRSCRKRLADHNRRRRKPQSNSNNNNNAARIANDESAPLKEDLQDSATNNPSNGAQAKSVPCPVSQASTPAISLLSPVPLMIQNKDRQMSVAAPISTHDPMYHRYLHTVNPQTGPKLSLSSSLSSIPMENHQWRQQQHPHHKAEEDGKNYEPIKQSCVPWLRQHSINESISPQNINLQPENSASSNGSCSHAFSPNLLPVQSSRSGLSRNWAMNNAREHSRDQGHFNTDFSTRVPNAKFEGNLKGQHQVLSLLESSSTFKDYHKRQQQKGISSSETESSSTSGSESGGDVKAFPDLHDLRPFASPSAFDSNVNTALI